MIQWAAGAACGRLPYDAPVFDPLNGDGGNGGGVGLAARRLVDGHQGEMRGVPGLFGLRDGHKPVVDTVYHLLCHRDGVVEIVLVLPDGVVEHEGVIRGETWLIFPASRHVGYLVWLVCNSICGGGSFCQPFVWRLDLGVEATGEVMVIKRWIWKTGEQDV